MADAEIQPFRIFVADEVIADLHDRIDRARWPDQERVPDASQGAQLVRVERLVDHWRNGYSWRALEERLNSYPNFVTAIDGVDIHFMHVRSRHADALPMILTHGWPGSIVEFLDVIGQLTDPEAHGGKKEDAFHLVIPSLPGFGFSGKPGESGWTVDRIAIAWEQLMERIGYDRYVAQGGDVGAAVSSTIGGRAGPGIIAVHVNQPFVLPKPPYENPTADEQRMLDKLAHLGADETAYAEIQMTRPQTLGYGLADSPVGQAAWIYEKLAAWSDCDGDPEGLFGLDRMLDNISIYWFTNSATSAARFYWDNRANGIQAIPINVPAGCSIFPKELYLAPRSWAERFIPKLMYWNEVERGGHFAAFEQPALFVRELRACFSGVR